MPSGGNAAALALIELGAIAGDRTMHGLGERAARAAAPRAVESPFGSGFLLVVLDHLVGQSREAVVAGDPDDPRTRALWAEIRPTTAARVLPVRLPASGAPDSLVERFGALRGKVALDGAPTALAAIDARGEEIHRARRTARRDITRLLAAESDRVGHLAARLATLGPAATLARGYAVVQGLPTDGPPHVLHSVNDAPAGARLRIRVADGALTALSEGAVDDEQGGADEAH